MDFANQLAELLNDSLKNNPELTGWRFDLHEAGGIEVGLKNNRIGGPYSAPSYKRSISGEIYLIWDKQRFTVAKLDSKVVAEFKEYFTLWQTTAYYDPDGVGLYQPNRIPGVNLVDEQVKKIIEHDSNLPFQLLEEGLQELTTNGLRKIDGKVRCYQGNRILMNSNGLRVDSPQTPVEFFFEVNDSYGESYQERKWPAETEIARVIRNTGNIGKLLIHEVPGDLSGKIRILFPPNIFESFLSQFLVTNLFGSLVVNRQSRFSLADFQNRRQILREDLSLTVDTLVPFRSFSYPCTSEGVPGGTIAYISAGKLQTPILNLKYAKKAGLQPTPVPAGGFFLKTAQAMESWEQLIRQTERGIIVYSVLGLHTQDSSSGHFSLTADQCLLVDKGEVVGKVKGVINGDFLGSLLQEDSQFGYVDGEDNPGYAFWATVAG